MTMSQSPIGWVSPWSFSTSVITSGAGYSIYPATAAAIFDPYGLTTSSVTFSDGTVMTSTSTAGTTLTAGTYTPTLTSTLNSDGVSAYEAKYSRVGNIVTVSGALDFDPTASGAVSYTTISVPIVSDLATEYDCAGTAVNGNIGGESGHIGADASADECIMVFFSGTTSNYTWRYIFQYEVK